MEIRKATPEDIDRISLIHSRALPEAFLPRLGRRFLKRNFYPLALDDDLSICLLAEDKNDVVGFVVLAYNSDLFNKLLQNKSSKNEIALSIFLRGFKDPGLYFQAYNILFNSKDEFEKISKIAIADIPGIIIIATDPSNQGKGIGSALINEAVDFLNLNGKHTLCRVEGRTTQAIKFYEKNGFKKIGTQQRGKIVYSILIRSLVI